MPLSSKRVKAVALAIGERIATMRNATGLTQAKLAEKVGTSAPVISRLETGRELASMLRYVEIADALGCEMHDLIATVDAADDVRVAALAEIAVLLRRRSPADVRRVLATVRAALTA